MATQMKKIRKEKYFPWVFFGGAIIIFIGLFGVAALCNKAIQADIDKGRAILLESAALYDSGQPIGHIDSITPFPIKTGGLAQFWGTQIKTEHEIFVITTDLSRSVRGSEVRRLKNDHGKMICIRNELETKCYFEMAS